MPLVVPGITSQGGDKSKTEEWSDKLVGKKLGESSDAMVFPSVHPHNMALEPTEVETLRHSQELSYQRKHVLSNQARW